MWTHVVIAAIMLDRSDPSYTVQHSVVIGLFGNVSLNYEAVQYRRRCHASIPARFDHIFVYGISGSLSHSQPRVRRLRVVSASPMRITIYVMLLKM